MPTGNPQSPYLWHTGEMPKGLNWLYELRATTRSQEEARHFRYCRLRLPPGAFGERDTWGHVTCLFEVDAVGRAVRELHVFDSADFSRHFDRDHPHSENAKGERFGGSLRTDPLPEDVVENGRIAHDEFEHAWLTGHLGERGVEAYCDELFWEALSDPLPLWEAWATAEAWYPYQPASGTLAIAERAIAHLLHKGFGELGNFSVNDRKVPEIVPYAATTWSSLLMERRSWMTPPIVWLWLTERGVNELQSRGRRQN
jgi:hypothetical protein